jgi:hypothetical protein
MGLVGHGFCIVLVEEIGRWPGLRSLVAGSAIRWGSRTVDLAQIPNSFLPPPDLEESVIEGAVQLVSLGEIPKLTTPKTGTSSSVSTEVTLPTGSPFAYNVDNVV